MSASVQPLTLTTYNTILSLRAINVTLTAIVTNVCIYDELMNSNNIITLLPLNNRWRHHMDEWCQQTSRCSTAFQLLHYKFRLKTVGAIVVQDSCMGKSTDTY